MTADMVVGIFVILIWLACCIGGVMFGWSLATDNIMRSWTAAIFVWLLAAALFFVPLAFAFLPHQPSKPCVRQEKQLMWDPALKMTREMEFCAQYGEWTTPEPKR